MHEIGHNFGLKHGGDSSVNQKPNYVSVMNYAYEATGIVPSDGPGSVNYYSCNVDKDCGPPAIMSGVCNKANACWCGSQNYCYRVDYSNEIYGTLDEKNLIESAGVSGAMSDQDIILYFVPGNPTVELLGASVGGIDWDNQNGIQGIVAVDVNNDGTMGTLTSWRDWTNLNLAYQCTSGYGAGAPHAWKTDELARTNREWPRRLSTP
jgi:hypothetical protein